MTRIWGICALSMMALGLGCGETGTTGHGSGGSSGAAGSAGMRVDAGNAGAGVGGTSAGGTRSTNTGGTAGKTGGNAGSGGTAGSGAGTGGTGGSGGSLGPANATAVCSTCHGSDDNPAPPKDTNGDSATSTPTVGAHQRHLAKSDWHAPVSCVTCHVVPSKAAYDASVPSHMNGKHDFKSSGIAGTSAAFDETSLTCASVYCHGTTLGNTTKPVWNKVDGKQAACGTCHTLPPGGTHPKSTACQTCHGAVIASFTPGTPPAATWKNGDLHINGKVEMADSGGADGGTTLTCTTCHGDATSGAINPPKGTNGETKKSDAAVGAHAEHLATSTWHRAGQCSDCHTLPTSTAHSNGKVDFTWGGSSNADGALSAFSTSALTCTNTYCHGSTLAAAASGGSVKRTPVWNKVDGSWDACGTTCHTNPPGGTHAKSNQCGACHADVISALNGTNATWKNPALHIDGKTQSNTPNCTACHGNPPTTGTHARRQHKVACSNCHPNSGSGATHLNGKTDVTCGSGNAGCHGN